MSGYGLEAELQALERAREEQRIKVAADKQEALKVAGDNIVVFLELMERHSIPASPLKLVRIGRIRRRRGAKVRGETTLYTDSQYHGWCLKSEQYGGEQYIMHKVEDAVVLTTEGLIFGCELRLDPGTKQRDLLVVKPGQYAASLDEWSHAREVLAATRRLAIVMDAYIQGVQYPWKQA